MTAQTFFVCAVILFLVESNDFICNTVEENSNSPAGFSAHTDDGKRSVMAIVSAPFVVVLFAIFPHFLKLGIRLVAFVQAREHNGNSKEHKQFVLEIFFEHGLCNAIKIANCKALFADKELMRIAFDNGCFLHRLVGSTDPITVEICWKIVHFLHTWQRFADH